VRYLKAFTLIELMLAVVFVGILAIFAIPYLVEYTNRAKISELGRSNQAQSTDTHAIVKVYFGTDRELLVGKQGIVEFGSSRSSISYGWCDVSIPREHQMGQLEAPSVWRFEFREDPKSHVVLLKIAVQPEEGFFRQLSYKVLASRKRTAFVFVHGYNVSFGEAARRTAQMAYDLGFEGAPAFFSWPSRGEAGGYIADEANAEWTGANLKEFLRDFITRSGAERIYLISHSMGGRPLTRALLALFEEGPKYRDRVQELILTAPDIDAAVFKRDIAPKLREARQSTTLYASSTDKALAFSKKLHGYARAGESGDGIVVSKGIETIDATDVDTDLGFGHSYYAEARSVLGDMFYVINEGKRASERFGLRPVPSSGGVYWAFKR
jgi:esterase/lipase superfamily enzyme